jgi:hypothetical protein
MRLPALRPEERPVPAFVPLEEEEQQEVLSSLRWREKLWKKRVAVGYRRTGNLF